MTQFTLLSFSSQLTIFGGNCPSKLAPALNHCESFLKFKDQPLLLHSTQKVTWLDFCNVQKSHHFLRLIMILKLFKV